MNRERLAVGAGVVLVAFAVLACGRKDDGSAAAASASATEPAASVTAADPAAAVPSATTPTEPITCAAGKVAAGTAGECITVCTDSAPCADAKADCVKSSYLARSGMMNVRVCRTSADPAVRDMIAGRPWLNDQVPKELASAAPATATAKPALPPGSDFMKPNADGDCPRGFTMNGGASCSRICTSNAGCHAPNVCVSQPVGTTKVCDEPGGA